MASQSSSSESQSLRVLWRLLIRGNIRTRSGPAPGVSSIGSWAVELPGLPRLFSDRTRSSAVSVASVYLKKQSNRSAGAHLWELGAVPRSACIIPHGIGLSLYGSGAHVWRNLPTSARSVPSSHFFCIMIDVSA